MIKPLNGEQKTALLSRRRVGRLGCIVAGAPYVVPVNYVFDGENIYSHSLPGTKIAALRQNPAACVQVDDLVDEFHWQSVMAVGDYQEITSERERDSVLSKLLARLPGLTPVESTEGPVEKLQEAQGRHPVVYRIKIREVSGVGEF
ncbi:MAG TPA: pyridoxamine 5'-phosphate oxidase family protein [Blastocatellia bacterium]|nr:pyridoxamine 5'-phosphate oxidase family protein [Blastocatellia bacterium]